MDLARLRRRAVFERLLVRLERNDPGRWILKGGMAMEVRIGNRARATRDLDLAMRQASDEEATVSDLFATALNRDPTGDNFDFVMSEAIALAPDQLGHAGWRFPLDARLAGRTFERIRVDIVARSEELVETERLALPDLLGFAGIETSTVEAADPAQQFAEKLHALTRDYGRPNSRVRDLVDLILLVEGGLAADVRLRDTVNRVFDVRGDHEVPVAIVDPPSDWRDRFAEQAAALDVRATSLDEALKLLRDFWRGVRDVS